MQALSGKDVCLDPPRAIRDATPPRAEHEMRKLPEHPAALPLAKRARPDHAAWVPLELEVDTRKAFKNSGGKVAVRDIEEILGPMGGRFEMPTANLFIGWSTDA